MLLSLILVVRPFLRYKQNPELWKGIQSQGLCVPFAKVLNTESEYPLLNTPAL